MICEDNVLCKSLNIWLLYRVSWHRHVSMGGWIIVLVDELGVDSPLLSEVVLEVSSSILSS